MSQSRVVVDSGTVPISSCLAQARSKRSAFMTLVQALTKSRANFLGSVGGGVDLGVGAELRVGPEDQVDRGGRPRDLSALAVSALIEAFGAGRLPFGAHIDQVDEEVVAQCAWAVGEHTGGGVGAVGPEDAQASDEDSHLRGGEAEEAGPVDKEFLGPALFAGRM